MLVQLLVIATTVTRHWKYSYQFIFTNMPAIELPIAELINLSEAIAIIATLFVIFYFSRKEMRNVSIDIETKVLNECDS